MLLEDAETRAQVHEKVYRRGPGECHYWLGALSSSGHGRVRLGVRTASALRPASVVMAAHVYLYQESRGLLRPLPDGSYPLVRHRCGELSCLNPIHLAAGTAAGNAVGALAARGTTGPAADVRGAQSRAIAIRDHLIRNTFHLASKRDWDALRRDVKPIYTAVNAAAARAALEELAERWGQRYPAIIRLWHNAWEQFIPFLDYDIGIRQVICSTNAIESLNARYRRAVKARGHFPTEQAALKCLYLVTRSLDPTGRGKARWAMRWKPVLNAFATTFGDRFPAAETY